MKNHQDKYRAAAKRAIKRNAAVIYDVAADRGQIVGNIKHMPWFVDVVADWIQEDEQTARDFAEDTL